MSAVQLNEIRDEVIRISHEVAAFIKAELENVKAQDIVVKDLNSLVSYVDETAERMFVEKLGSLIPEATFITEEETVDPESSALTWIIDPLDGTNNFLHKIPHFATSVALQQDRDIVIGVVVDVMKDETFSATRGGGSFLNNVPITVSQIDSTAEALLAVGFPYANDFDHDKLIEILMHWLKNSRGIRRQGAAALDLCYVAAGRYDVYYELTLNAWDVAAGALIVEEAGGKVSDFLGEDNYLFGKELVASNTKMHTEVLSIIRNSYSDRSD